MKLFVLHLSDIHFDSQNDYHDNNVNGIVNALQIGQDIENVLIIVSGDIAFSGYDMQYDVAQSFFRNLKNSIMNRYNVKKIIFLIVPGNHDVNYDKGMLTNEEFSKIDKSNKWDSYIENERQKVASFFNFSNKMQCFIDDDLVSVIKLNYGDTSIQVNLINTAFFSSRCQDQGYHYLPQNALEKLSKPSDCDYIFTVMHHPHHWFNWRMKKVLESIIYENNDVIFVGHEHYLSDMSIDNSSSTVYIYAGGELANKGDWSNSEFYSGVLDLANRQFSVTHYRWDNTNNIYVRKEDINERLSRNRFNEIKSHPKKEYLRNLLQDNKYMIGEGISDYFVFPLLEEEVLNDNRLSKEISALDDFVEEISKRRKLIILGRSDTGKTTLAKQLYKRLSEQNYVIYIESSNIYGNRYEQPIRISFEESYSNDYVKYEAFKQCDKDKKVIIIDDVDEIESSIFNDFLHHIEELFGTIILTSRRVIELDIKERIKQVTILEQYTFYRILPFYTDKRKELITKITQILIKHDSSRMNVVSQLCDALTKQRNLFKMDPDFIVSFVKYYCTNIGESIRNDGNIFSKVFESNIVSLLKPNTVKMNVDKILIVLDKIAYRMHTDKDYPMSQENICSVIRQYNEEFDSDIDYLEFISVVLKSRILAKDRSKYSFTERNYLSYFVAREIKRRCLEENDYEEFNRILEFSCFDINADILLFVTYITDNLNIIQMLMRKAEEYCMSWDEFEMNPVAIPYLSDTNQLSVKKIEASDRERERKNEEVETVNREKQEEKEKERNGKATIYDYDEDTIDWLDEMIRAMSLSIVLARTLPSFEHMMKKPDKEKCVSLIYSMPLKIFNVWAKQVEEWKDDLAAEIKELHEWEYRNQKTPIDDKDVLNYLRWTSISLLMELMNISMSYATGQNTLRYIDSYSYSDKISYEIEHLMSLDKRDAVNEFIDEAEKMYENQRQYFSKILIRRVTKHFIVTSKKITSRNIQRLNSKLWNDQQKSSLLLLNKQRNARKQ